MRTKNLEDLIQIKMLL